MPHRLLMPEQMARADRLTIAAGTLDGFGLMRRAASAVAGTALARFPEATGCDILCGPGNNGGDGYALAWLLEESGMPVRVWARGRPRPGTDAARAMAGWCGATRPLEEFRPEKGALVVDALFGAGLARPMDGAAASAAALCAEAA